MTYKIDVLYRHLESNNTLGNVSIHDMARLRKDTIYKKYVSELQLLLQEFNIASHDKTTKLLIEYKHLYADAFTYNSYKSSFLPAFLNKNSDIKLIINVGLECVFQSDTTISKLLKKNLFISF